MELRKGFYFSMDAVMALMIMSGSLVLVMQASENASTDFSTDSEEYSELSTTGRDAMKLASGQTLNSLNESYRQTLKTRLESMNNTEAMNKSILNGVSLLWASGDREEAKRLAKAYFDSNVPDRYEYSVKISESGNSYDIYSTKDQEGSPEIVTSSSTLVSGHMINRNSTGYRSRALLTSLKKNASKRVFFGGYVGQGLINYNVSLEGLQGTVQDVSITGDFSSDFNLSFNGQDAGSYTVSSGNLTVDEYQICTDDENESRCEALGQENSIVFEFTGENRSIRGGVLEIKYDKQEDVQQGGRKYQVKKKKFPGINGIINYYGSFYVPGELEGMEAQLNYEAENRTVFLQAGNTTIYKKENSDGENVTIDNESISQALEDTSMSYRSMSESTVPLRIGLGDIDTEAGYRGAIADSVSVMDVSGSMDGDRLAEAKNASKLFVDTILSAGGNKAGFVSYNEEVVDSHDLTRNAESLKTLIDSQVAQGNTCIGCGILEATDTLQGREKTNKIAQGSQWSYNSEYRSSRPPQIEGDNWKEPGYDDSTWNTSNTPISSDSELENFEGSVYFRKEFSVNHSLYSMDLGLYTNDVATVYINGQEVYNGTARHLARYWNRNLSLNSSNLRAGNNVVGIELKNSENDTERIRESSEAGWAGNFSNTTVDNGRVELRPQFASGSGVTAPQEITGITDRGFFFPYQTYIDQVQFNAIDHTSGNNDGYLDATDRVSDPLVPGKNYQLNVTFQTGGNTDYGTVAIDWDGDGDLSDQSVTEIGYCGSNGCQVSTQITVPEDAELGSLVMRVMGEEGGYHTDPTSADTLTEAEDYTVFVDTPDYLNGTYTSEINAGETVNWSSASFKTEEPNQTSIDYRFSVNETWKENITELEVSQSIRYRAYLNTSSNSVTPGLEEASFGYLLDSSRADFDASLNLTEKRKKTMIVMSDGNPNTETSMENVPNHYDGDGGFFDEIGGADHAIEAACRAKEEGIKVYSVGFGDANQEVMEQIADCGGGRYYSAQEDNLEDVFSSISNRILEASFVGQTVKEGSETSASRLYSDSYLKFNYTDSEGLEYGRIDMRMNTGRFGGSVESPKEEKVEIPNGTIRVPEGTDVESARVTSYSGNRWTSLVETNGSGEFETVFNLTDYGSNYPALGDPFTVSIPEEEVRVGTNTVRVDTALEPGDTGGGSPDNSVFYTLQFDNSVGYGKLFSSASAAETDAVRRLNQSLDFDGDGQPDVDFNESGLQRNSNILGDEPYLWGPANVKLVIWDE